MAKRNIHPAKAPFLGNVLLKVAQLLASDEFDVSQ